MEPRCRLWCQVNLILKSSLVPLQFLKLGLESRGAESLSDRLDQTVKFAASFLELTTL